MRSFSKVTFALVVMTVFFATTLWINTIANRTLKMQVIESVDYARQAPHVIYQQLKDIIEKTQAPIEIPRTEKVNPEPTETPRCVDPDWSRLDLQSLSAKQLIDYFLWANRTSCRIVNDFGGKMLGRKSYVARDAHKAVCLDRAVAPVPDRCLVYSFGINFDWTFDEDMELYGCKVFSFDPSMNILNQTHSVSIEFYKMGLSDRNTWDDHRWPNVPMLTVNSFYELFTPKHGDVIIDYLKLDVEGAEWTVVPQLLRTGMLDKVRQLSIEFHIPADGTLEKLRSLAETVRSLETYGMVRFDSKPNLYSVANMTQLGFKAFDNYEIAFYNTKHVRHNIEIDSPL